jgi:ribosomal protein S8E
MLTFQISKGDVSNGFRCYQLSVMKERDVMAAERVSAKNNKHMKKYRIATVTNNPDTIHLARLFLYSFSGIVKILEAT